MTNVIKDVTGKVVSIGDTVAFAGAGRGASQFLTGKVSRFSGTMSIGIAHDLYYSGEGGYTEKVETVRKGGCFAIVEEISR